MYVAMYVARFLACFLACFLARGLTLLRQVPAQRQVPARADRGPEPGGLGDGREGARVPQPGSGVPQHQTQARTRAARGAPPGWWSLGACSPRAQAPPVPKQKAGGAGKGALGRERNAPE